MTARIIREPRGGLDVVMKNIVYDFYSKDLSVKVKTAKRQKMKRGEYRPAYLPFGLKCVEGERYGVEPDPEAAEVVREIFQCAIDGMRLVDIARCMNEEGHEPAVYYRKKHPGTKKFANMSDLKGWTEFNIRSILKQEMYYGAVVGHKRESVTVAENIQRRCRKMSRSLWKVRIRGLSRKKSFRRRRKYLMILR